MENELDQLSTEPMEIPHAFAVDLNLSVVTSYRYALERIIAAEEDELDYVSAQFAGEDHEVLLAALSGTRRNFDELREAASRLALVGSVTRFGHWLEKLAKKVPARSSAITYNLKALENEVGRGPESASYFKQLVDVRDSIIHANAAATWTYNHERSVAARYRNPYGTIEFSEKDFEEAVSKMVSQISWYDEQIQDDAGTPT